MKKSGVISIILVTLMVFSFAVSNTNSQAALVGRAATELAKGMLGKGGGKLFELIFGGVNKPEAIDYTKITNIMKSELSEHDYKLAVGNYNEHLNNIRDRFKTFNSDWNKKGADRQSLGRNIRNDLDKLESDADDLIGNYPVQGVYLYGAIQTLRLAIFASMAQERDMASGFTFEGLERESFRVQARMAKVDFNEARLAFIKCEGGNVVDTFVPRQKIGSGREGCERIAEGLQVSNPTLKRYSTKQESRMGSYTSTSYTVEVSGISFEWCGERTAKCDQVINHVDNIKNDAKARADFAATVIRGWQKLTFASEANQRIPSTSLMGESITNFRLENKTGYTLEVKWHANEGWGTGTGWVTATGTVAEMPSPLAIKNGEPVPDGESWSPSGGNYLTSQWFGIYIQDPNSMDCDGIYEASRVKSLLGCRTKLVANFKLWNQGQGDAMIVRSINPEAISERSVLWVMDPEDIRYRIKDYIMQTQQDGSKVLSLPLPLSACRKKCEDDASCEIIRVSNIDGQACLMGSSIGVISNTTDDRDMTSWRIVSREGPYVIKRSN